MKKHLNNKGYMLVEIILASVLAMVVAYFVIDLTIKLKNKNDDLLVRTLTATDQAIIYNTIMKDFYDVDANLDCNYVERMLDIDSANNVFKYGNFTNIVNEYASIENYTCSIEDDLTLNLVIPINVKQLPDDDFDVIYVSNVKDENKSDVSACLTSSMLIDGRTEDDYLSDDLVGGLYRYQGTYTQVTNNFICFGTEDQSDCLSDTSTYNHLYRIIGFTEDGDIRVIKYYPLKSLIKYDTSGYNYNWSKSNLKSKINGSSFLTSTTYVPDGWNDLITSSKWYYTTNGTSSCSSGNGVKTYTYETGLSSLSAKVGVMQAFDYMLSLDNTTTAGTASFRTSWIDLYNNYYKVNSDFHDDPREWTIPKRGYITYDDGSYGYYGCLVAIGTLTTSYASLSGSRYVRPVFNINSSVVFVEGTGTIDDPYIISTSCS